MKITDEEITQIFLQLSEEMNIPFIKGPYAKPNQTINSSRVISSNIPYIINNATMITYFKEHYANTEALMNLFINYEELFIRNVQCVRDDIKALLLPIIQTKYPNASIQPKNPKVKHIVLG